MGARTFDGTDDKITCSNGDTDFVFGPGTIAFVLRKGNNNSMRPFMQGSAGATRLGMRFNSTSDLSLQCGSTLQVGAVTISSSDGWALAAITKGNGSVNPRYHKYIYSSDAHTHADGSATVANNTAPTADPVIGANNSNEFFNGDIAIGALWDVALTDAQIEALPFSLAAWFAPGQPRALWLLDQADVGQALADMTGRGANQNAITGTAVATESVPVFNYGFGPALERITAGGATIEADARIAAILQLAAGPAVARVSAAQVSALSSQSAQSAVARVSSARIGAISSQSAQSAVARVSSARIDQRASLSAAPAVSRIAQVVMAVGSSLRAAGAVAGLVLADARLAVQSTLRGAAVVARQGAARIFSQSFFRGLPLVARVGAARLLARTGLTARFFQDTAPIAAKVSVSLVNGAKVSAGLVTGAKVTDASVTKAKITVSLGG